MAPMNRHDEIRHKLDYLQEHHIVLGWESNSPGNVGKRWHVWSAGPNRGAAGHVTYTTQQVECFIEGALAAVAAYE